MAKGQLIQLAEESSCTGCGACLNVCPTGSICMKPVEDSLHLYPLVSEESCVKCGKCMQVCPVLRIDSLRSEQQSQQYYCAWNKSREERFRSTSGGVGAAIVTAALKKGYYVVGARLNKDWHVEHVVTNKAEIGVQFRGSKYLLSDTTNVFKQVKSLISAGEKVLFIGTPCQVAGVKAVIPSPKDLLLTCGIICHGVNAPIVWLDYVRYLQKKKRGVLMHYNFRSKKKGWGKLFVEYEMMDGHHYVEPAWKNLFHVWFGQHYMMREACFHCLFRKEERYSDLVIGDFWGIDKILPKLDTSDGVSVLITTTKKGQEFVDSLDTVNLIAVDAKRTLMVLKGFLPTKTNEESVQKQIDRMHLFARQYYSKSFYEMTQLYPCPTRLDLLLASIRYHLGIIK